MSQHPRSLHIVADENIPLRDESVHPWGVISRVPAAQIDRALLAHADALLVRSVSRVNSGLLDGSAVRFVGTATTGVDHVDVEYLARRGIAFSDAAGSNAMSVVDYVLSAVGVMCRRDGVRLPGQTVGVVGCGRIGETVARRLEMAGATVLRCDPPRAREEGGNFESLDVLLRECDIVSLHTPLTREGEDATHHLLDVPRLQSMKPGAWLVNTSRGSVVEAAALASALAGPNAPHVVLDVWENEPHIDPAILARVDIATPHIAGYAYDGKLRGGEMVLAALARFFEQDFVASEPGEDGPDVLSPPDPFLPETDGFIALSRAMYDIEADDRRMRHVIKHGPSIAEAFTALRRDYPVRREFSAHRLSTDVGRNHRRIVSALGLSVSDAVAV